MKLKLTQLDSLVADWSGLWTRGTRVVAIELSGTLPACMLLCMYFIQIRERNVPCMKMCERARFKKDSHWGFGVAH